MWRVYRQSLSFFDMIIHVQLQLKLLPNFLAKPSKYGNEVLYNYKNILFIGKFPFVCSRTNFVLSNLKKVSLKIITRPENKRTVSMLLLKETISQREYSLAFRSTFYSFRNIRTRHSKLPLAIAFSSKCFLNAVSNIFNSNCL